MFFVVLTGFGAAPIALYVGLEHDPQHEFDLPDGSLDWSYLGILYAAWFGAGSLAASMLCSAGWLMARIVPTLTARRQKR